MHVLFDPIYYLLRGWSITWRCSRVTGREGYFAWNFDASKAFICWDMYSEKQRNLSLPLGTGSRNSTPPYACASLISRSRSFTLQNQCKNQENDKNPSRRTPHPIYPVSIKPGKTLFQISQQSDSQDQNQQQKRQQVGIDVTNRFLVKLRLDLGSPVDIERWEHGDEAQEYGQYPLIG